MGFVIKINIKKQQNNIIEFLVKNNYTFDVSYDKEVISTPCKKLTKKKVNN